MPLRSANVVGSGPNGLACAIALAQAGVRVTVYERGSDVGGACSTGEATLPGFHHDLGSSVYPLGVASPFFRTLPLERHGLKWIEPEAPLAHPLDDGTAVMLEHSVQRTAAQLGEHDGRVWERLFAPLVDDWERLVDAVMHPLLRVPRHPVALTRFGLSAALPAVTLAKRLFRGDRARALLAGNTAHSVLPLTHLASSAPGLVLVAAAHATGWPLAAGGAQSLSHALADYLLCLGGRILLNAEVRSFAQLDPSDVTLFDTSAPALDRIAGDALTPSFRTRMRHFRQGPAAFKLDWALSAPIPWTAKECARAATVHLGGTLEELARSEAAAYSGKRCERPFVLLVQPSLFDPGRAPEGKHTAWAYCHVPHGSREDYTASIEAQVERFAPGFRSTILARRAWSPGAFEAWNPNLIGGDLSGGAMTLTGLLTRPTAHLWRTSHPGIYLCSSSTPPGGGVHGMCGFLAAQAALRDHKQG
jgi:phytoene dehydrogenase-like protein